MIYINAAMMDEDARCMQEGWSGNMTSPFFGPGAHSFGSSYTFLKRVLTEDPDEPAYVLSREGTWGEGSREDILNIRYAPLYETDLSVYPDSTVFHVDISKL